MKKINKLLDADDFYSMNFRRNIAVVYRKGSDSTRRKINRLVNFIIALSVFCPTLAPILHQWRWAQA